MKHPRIYAMLKSAGHSPQKAAEVILDAGRGDKRARDWIKVIWSARHDEPASPTYHFGHRRTLQVDLGTYRTSGGRVW